MVERVRTPYEYPHQLTLLLLILFGATNEGVSQPQSIVVGSQGAEVANLIAGYDPSYTNNHSSWPAWNMTSSETTNPLH
jgi:hypothetical protein